MSPQRTTTGADEARGGELERRLAAVWFADIVGFTRLADSDEDAALAAVGEFQRATRAAVEVDSVAWGSTGVVWGGLRAARC